MRVPHDVPTLQAAIDASSVGGTIYLDPGVPPERVVIDKRLLLIGAGGEVTDDGLEEDEEPIITLAPGSKYTTLRDLSLVATGVSPVGVRIADEFCKVEKGTYAGSGTSVGISIDAVQRVQIVGTSAAPVTLVGFETGLVVVDSEWFKIQRIKAFGNGTGVEVTGGKGQLFWSEISFNDIGLESYAGYQIDYNSNVFDDNVIAIALGMRSGTYNNLLELRNTILGDGAVASIETAPGTWVQDYKAIPQGNGNQWHLLINGVQHPVWTI